MKNQVHVVKSGDTLSSIAAQYGLPSWTALYYDQRNTPFRRTHPDPNLIRVGARLHVPETPNLRRKAIQVRLTRLEKAKVDAKRLFDEQENELARALWDVKRTDNAVDVTAMVASIISSLTKLTMKVFTAMKVSDEVVVKEFTKEIIKQKLSQGRDIGALVISSSNSESDHPGLLLAKSVAQAWCDMNSPSFWAHTVVLLGQGSSWSKAVATTPKDIHDQALANLKATSDNVFADLDRKISQARAELADVDKGRSGARRFGMR